MPGHSLGLNLIWTRPGRLAGRLVGFTCPGPLIVFCFPFHAVPINFPLIQFFFIVAVVARFSSRRQLMRSWTVSTDNLAAARFGSSFSDSFCCCCCFRRRENETWRKFQAIESGGTALIRDMRMKEKVNGQWRRVLNRRTCHLLASSSDRGRAPSGCGRTGGCIGLSQIGNEFGVTFFFGCE